MHCGWSKGVKRDLLSRPTGPNSRLTRADRETRDF
jgi:hypothetical protein